MSLCLSHSCTQDESILNSLEQVAHMIEDKYINNVRYESLFCAPNSLPCLPKPRARADHTELRRISLTIFASRYSLKHLS